VNHRRSLGEAISVAQFRPFADVASSCLLFVFCYISLSLAFLPSFCFFLYSVSYSSCFRISLSSPLLTILLFLSIYCLLFVMNSSVYLLFFHFIVLSLFLSFSCISTLSFVSWLRRFSINVCPSPLSMPSQSQLCHKPSALHIPGSRIAIHRPRNFFLLLSVNCPSFGEVVSLGLVPPTCGAVRLAPTFWPVWQGWPVQAPSCRTWAGIVESV